MSNSEDTEHKRRINPEQPKTIVIYRSLWILDSSRRDEGTLSRKPC